MGRLKAFAISLMIWMILLRGTGQRRRVRPACKVKRKKSRLLIPRHVGCPPPAFLFSKSPPLLVSMYVCVGGRERESEFVCVCVRKRERLWVWVWVRVRKRETERSVGCPSPVSLFTKYPSLLVRVCLGVGVGVGERERERVCVCVCVRERERERRVGNLFPASLYSKISPLLVFEYVYIYTYVYIYVCICTFVDIGHPPIYIYIYIYSLISKKLDIPLLYIYNLISKKLDIPLLYIYSLISKKLDITLLSKVQEIRHATFLTRPRTSSDRI